MTRHSIASLITILALVLVVPVAEAQLVAFSGKDANSPDEFAFVALTDIPNSTTIYFTNQDWDNTTGQFTNPGAEGSLSFTSTALITKGTVVQVSETSADTFTVTGSGTATILAGDGWSPTSADPHYAFSASNPGSPLSTVTEIHAFASTLSGGIGANQDPRTGTNASPNAVVAVFTSQPVGFDYSADRSTAMLADLENAANFTESSGATNLTLDLTSFTNAGLPVALSGFEVK